jgi:hypothetical protein
MTMPIKQRIIESADYMMNTKAPTLAAMAAFINEYGAGVFTATVRQAEYTSYGPKTGRVFVREARSRMVTQITIRSDGRDVFEHASGEPYRTNSDVSKWIVENIL